MKRVLSVLLLTMLLISGITLGEDSFELIGRGSKGETVVRIQERLFDLGYYTYKPTGSYQNVTRNAVQTYQSEAGLMNDGTIGSETYRALFSYGAKRIPFRASVPLGYSSQNGTLSHGFSKPWSTVKKLLTVGEAYTVTNAATKESCSLVFAGGEHHAEFTVPMHWNRPDAETVRKLTAWLGDTNSYYKCAVLLNLDGQSVAASMQWNGADAICLYTKGSTSHVFGLADADHDAMIDRISD